MSEAPISRFVWLDATCALAGMVIRCDKHGQNFASADIARIRLRDVVKRDRAAVPCGRWVKTGRRVPTLPEVITPEFIVRSRYDRRMRYRWKVRR